MRSRRGPIPRTHLSGSRPTISAPRPACSTASHEVSSSKRCCGSIAVASRSVIPKNSGIEARNVVEEPAPSRHRPTRAHRARGRSTRRRPSGRRGISVTRSSPRSNASHNRSGESMPPGSRHAMPMTATGLHTCLAHGRIPAFPCSAQAGNPAPSHLATLDLPTEIQANHQFSGSDLLYI